MNTTFVDKLDYFGTDCSDLRVCAYYAGVHAISLEDYVQLKSNLFGSATVADKSYPADVFDFTVDCGSYEVKYDTGTSVSDNSGLKVKVVQASPLIGRFSIHLFRALQNYFNPDSYDFTQILTLKNGVPTVSVAFRVIKNGVAVYHGDLTNMYP